jgi:hypothetical protein
VRVSAVVAAFETIEHAVRGTHVHLLRRNHARRRVKRRACASAPRHHHG